MSTKTFLFVKVTITLYDRICLSKEDAFIYLRHR